MRERVILENLVHKIMEGGLKVNRFLVYGPPGTGKSSFPFNLGYRVRQVTLTQESSPEDLVGHWIVRNSEMVFLKGPATDILENGGILVINEIDRLNSAVASILHNILDDRDIVQIHLPDGEIIKPSCPYIIWATTNYPEALESEEALLDRFDFIVRFDYPSDEMMSAIHETLYQMVRDYYDSNKKQFFFKKSISYRDALVITELKEKNIEKEVFYWLGHEPRVIDLLISKLF